MGKRKLIAVAWLALLPFTANAVPFYADTVLGTPDGGAGSGVINNAIFSGDFSYTGPVGPNTFDIEAVNDLDGVSWAMGEGPFGSIILGFATGYVFDGVGDDILIWDTNDFNEGISVEASSDGSNWTFLEEIFGDNSSPCFFALAPACSVGLDFANYTGVSSASWFRLTAAPFSVTSSTVGSGFDLDALQAVNFMEGSGPGPDPEPVPEPGTLALFGFGLAALGLSRRKKKI